MAESLSPHPGDILIIADDPATSKTLTTILKAQGHRLQQAGSGELALKIVGPAPPDLILLAVALPRMDGYALCERLKAEAATAAIPIILLSPADGPLDRARVFAAGGADYLTMPFEAAEVVARVETQLALRATRSDLTSQKARLAHEIAERQQVEAALTENNQKLRDAQTLASLVDNVSDAIISTDVAFNIKSWNKAAERLYGWRAEEVVGQPITAITEMRYPDRSLDEVVAEFFAAGQWRGEVIQTHRDGRELWVSAAVTLLRDERGQPVGTVAINQDITERKQAEESLVLYQQIFASTPEPISFVDTTYRYRLANDAYETYSAIDREQFIGRTVADYLGREVFEEAIKPHFDQCLQGQVIRYQAWFEYPTLGRRYVDVTYYPVRDGAGQIIGLVANTQDMTEQKEAEEQIRFQARLLETVEQAIIATDPAGRVIYLNPFAERLFGWSAAEALGKTTLELMATEESLALGQEIMATLKRGESWSGEYLAKDRSGRRFPIYTSTNPVYDDQGRLKTLIGVSWDMTERKRAEQALQESEQRYRAIIENSADGIVLYNQTGAIVEWNHALAAMTGIPQAEALGQMAWDIHAALAQPPSLTNPEEIKDVMMAFLTGQAAADGVLYEYDIKHAATGERRSFQTRMFALRLVDERVIGSAVRDITERKQAEETLQKSEAQYRLLAANLPETDAYLFDKEMRYLIAEGPLMRRGGMTPGGFEGQRLPDLLDQERRDLFIPTYQRALAGEHVKTDFTYGGHHYYHQVMPLIDEQGEIYGGIALTQDITERKRAEAALRESEAKYRTIANNVPGLVLRYKLNPDGSDELLFLSEGVEAIYEIPRDEAVKDVSILWQMIHPDDLDEYAASVQASAERLSFWEREHRILLPDGRVKWLHGRGLPKKLADGSVVWDTLGVDITERKQLETELIRARDAAEAANKAKSVFLANMSHELRTPLNGVLGYAQVLQHYTTLDPEQQRHVKTIEQSGQHLLTLINDVLDIAKIEAGKISLQLATFNLAEFLTNLSNIIRIRTKQKGVLFVTDFDPDLPELVRGDEKRLRQILINLLGNAVKFTDDGQIFFTVTELERHRKDRSRLRFTVKDTGQGIPMEEQDEIFKPFHQAVDSQKFQEGTGLGLAISQHLAQLMDSLIQVKSQPGVGSTFWLEVELPVVRGPLSSTKADSSPKIVGFRGEETPTILVVDDVSTNRDVLHNFLTALGFKVLVAEDGLQGLAMAEALEPDLILADLRMPRLDGYEMVRRLRQVEALQAVPVIGISASVYAEDAQKSLAAGCNAFLPKPVDLDDLTSLLAQHLALAWVYKEKETGDEPPPDDPTLFIMPPPDMLRELQMMVDIGDIQGIQRYLEQIEVEDEQYAPFVDEMARLSNDFQINAIQRLLREVVG